MVKLTFDFDLNKIALSHVRFSKFKVEAINKMYNLIVIVNLVLVILHDKSGNIETLFRYFDNNVIVKFKN